MPSDLIYREDAKDFVRHAYHKGLNPVEYLDEIPAADVRENVKARWIDMGDHLLCSGCGATHYGVDKNFCPNCGADMRGEQDDESRSNSNAQTDTRARGMGATDKSSGI